MKERAEKAIKGYPMPIADLFEGALAVRPYAARQVVSFLRGFGLPDLDWLETVRTIVGPDVVDDATLLAWITEERASGFYAPDTERLAYEAEQVEAARARARVAADMKALRAERVKKVSTTASAERVVFAEVSPFLPAGALLEPALRWAACDEGGVKFAVRKGGQRLIALDAGVFSGLSWPALPDGAMGSPLVRLLPAYEVVDDLTRAEIDAIPRRDLPNALAANIRLARAGSIDSRPPTDAIECSPGDQRVRQGIFFKWLVANARSVVSPAPSTAWRCDRVCDLVAEFGIRGCLISPDVVFDMALNAAEAAIALEPAHDTVAFFRGFREGIARQIKDVMNGTAGVFLALGELLPKEVDTTADTLWTAVLGPAVAGKQTIVWEDAKGVVVRAGLVQGRWEHQESRDLTAALSALGFRKDTASGERIYVRA